MHEDEIKSLKQRLQETETEVEQLISVAETLHKNGVDVSTSNEILERQNEVQDSVEQLVSDLLHFLAHTDTAHENLELPEQARVPVQEGSLPEPENNEGSVPVWADDSTSSDSGSGSGN